MTFSEDCIIEGINSKEDLFWNKIYKDFFPSLCFYVTKIVKDQEIARDIVQNTFVYIWNKNIQFPDLKRLSIYLYRCSHNNALKHLRDTNCHNTHLETYKYESDEFTDQDFTDIIEQEVVRKLHSVISMLPKERRKILLMSLEGISGQQIADQLNVSINTVKQQKYRAYKFIKEQMGNNILLILLSINI